LFFLGVFLLCWGLSFGRPADSQGKEKIFIVRLGEDTRQVAARLEESGLIKSRYFFLFSLWRDNLQGKIQAGSFSLSPQMTTRQIAFNLTKGRLDQWLRVIEGLRREEIADQAQDELDIDKKSFILASGQKEGYLFPDSYLVPLKVSAESLVKMMNDNFEKRTAELWKRLDEKQMSRVEVVIIASLVEREAKEKNDRETVAGILIKRWKANWPLQVDATVQYVKGKENNWWPKIDGADLEIKSPFNSYLNLGLPPAPICNPSLESLEATVSFRESSYWFYLSDLSGKVHFAQNLEEHQRNIEKYLKSQ